MKARGSSAAVVKHLEADARFSDAESLRDALEKISARKVPPSDAPRDCRRYRRPFAETAER